MDQLEIACGLYVFKRFNDLSTETRKILALETDPLALNMAVIQWRRDFWEETARSLIH